MSGVAFRLRQLGGSCRHALHQDDQDGIGERDCPGSVFTLFKPVLCQRRATFFHLFSHSRHSFEHPKIGHHQTPIPHVYHCFQLHFWGSTIFTSTSTVNFPHFSVCESTFGCLTWLRRGFPRIHHAVFRMVWTLQPHLARRHSRPEIRFFKSDVSLNSFSWGVKLVA